MTKLKRVRLLRGFTCEALSEISGIKISVISDLDNGVILFDNAPIKYAYPLAVALRCKLEDLIEIK